MAPCTKNLFGGLALLAGAFGLALSCSGVEGGLSGSQVIARNDAHNRLLEARLLRVSLCNQNSLDIDSFAAVAVQRPRKVLDGAYYERTDIDRCYTSILITPCGQVPPACGLTPKEWYSGRLFQGGF
ncbi:MAG: hypothetical protein H7A21_19330 [Spirochaetales bacterium]|nr:hypothetical protein [Spirochaetales bacterium]MCP5486453.1 hypothetical protein [Spirochaetales bacterium]